jgi:ABC-2 type transport system ATP-binding protein
MTRQICLIRETGDTVGNDESVETALSFAAAMRPNWDAGYAAMLVERFQLSPRQKVGELSKGKRSALGIVLGLASRAPVTMFDESYMGMDAPSRYIFYEELLADFIRHPRTIVVSTHLIEEVASLFEEVVIIDKGRLVLHEEAETLRSRGAAVTGPAEQVDQVVDGLTVLSVKQLGPTKSAMVYGELGDARRQQAHTAELDVGPIALQDLFVHLTEPTGDAE